MPVATTRPITAPTPQLLQKITGEKKREAVVVGAGAFGGWAARDLQRAGYNVTLLDAWGPANARASSGDETRVLRAVYGDDELSTKNTARAMKLWRGLGEESGERIFHENGVLWFLRADDAYIRDSQATMEKEGLELEPIEMGYARERWPQVDFQGVAKVFLERQAGFLLAKRACFVVMRLLRERGGRYLQQGAEPGEIKNGKMKSVILTDGTELKADLFIFATGPWLGRMFPDVVGGKILPTRQETFYFGVPPGRSELTTSHLPVWVDFGGKITLYGVPSGGHHGFKAADDTRGPIFDPTDGDRWITRESVDAMRRRVAARFPALREAPFLEARVCQYEQTPDGKFIVDRHPEARNVVLVGGGSGHGFKQAPVIGELAARIAGGIAEPPDAYKLSRFNR